MGLKGLIILMLTWGLAAPVAGAWAQSSTSASASRTKVKKKKKRARVERATLRVGTMLWQEAIHFTKAGDEVNAETQSVGLFVGYGKSVPLSGLRWSYYYGAEAAIGVIKGRALSNLAINDGLKNQFWYLVGANPGVVYRTTAYTELGLFAPVWFRMINWKTNPSSDLDPQRDSSFSFGVQGQMVQRFSKTSALEISITQQLMWQATVWGVTWLHTFR